MAETKVSSIQNAIEALHRALDGIAGEDHPVLFSLACAQRAIDAALRDQVRREREAGTSWSDIGADLGVSKQGAQQRYGEATGGP